MQYEWTVNGIRLSDYVYVLRDTLYRPNHSVVRNPIQISGRHGTIDPGVMPVYDEASIGFTLGFFEHDEKRPAALQSVTIDQIDRMLNRIFSSGSMRIQREFNGITDVNTVNSVSIPPTISGDYGIDGAKWTVTVALDDPFFHATTAQDISVSSGKAVSQLSAYDAPIYRGTVIRINAISGTSVTITDALSGTGIIWNGALTSGNYLYIDIDSFAAWIATDSAKWEASSGVTDVSIGLDYLPSGPLQLWPAQSTTDIYSSVYRIIASSGIIVLHTIGARY